MKFFFHTPLNTTKKYKATYTIIRRIILTNANTLTLDWLNVLDSLEMRKIEINTQRVLKKAVEAIKDAELIVAEASNFTFETGYLINIATQLKKPTLVLVEKDLSLDSEISEMITNLQSEYCEIKKYYVQDLDSIITSFTEKNQGQAISRFNLMLEREQRNYLDWAQLHYRINKSEIIRELINQKAKNDLNYQRKINNVTQNIF